ncbi:cytochrome P450 [Glutamicibacter protophormiae]|uniref:cytochrome P450 n=1 Tax=Glutamicibacter protophormiae TaxID=37930 RepID=UPI00195864DE|nr:cytochrome P450 [Glutamicibacter protophormiae]QRQ77131.1 cytochrome P450 [Glutamicibacter protophormiae]
MSCPYAGTLSAAAGAPLARPLEEVLPNAVTGRYRSIEDPATVREILRRAEDFTPANALHAAVQLAPATLRILACGRFALPPVLASASGPEHLAVRRVVAGFFSPAKVAAQGQFITRRTRELCEQLREEFDAGAELDLAVELAAVIPPEVMARLAGTPVPPVDRLKRWSRDSLELFWGWPDAERQQELARSAVEYHAWLRGAVAEALARDDGNLYAALHQAGVDAKRIVSLAYFLGIAGQETTAMLIQSALFCALHDDDWADCADPATGESASSRVVQRVLLEASSVPTWRRITRIETELDGGRFAAGDELVLRLSGGRLAELGDDSLVFGFGLHRCLGAALARMETEVVLRTAAAAWPNLELADRSQPWGHLVSFQSPTAVRVRRATFERTQP